MYFREIHLNSFAVCNVYKYGFVLKATGNEQIGRSAERYLT